MEKAKLWPNNRTSYSSIPIQLTTILGMNVILQFCQGVSELWYFNKLVVLLTYKEKNEKQTSHFSL